MGYANEVVKIKEDVVVTLPQAKSWLNVDEDFTGDDALILSQIDQATSIVENAICRDIVTTNNYQELVDFEGSSVTFDEVPYVNIVSITKYDENDVGTSILSTEYTVKVRNTDFTVLFKESFSASRIEFVYITGYDFDTLPKSLLAAVLIKTNDLYDMERTSHTVGVNQRSTGAFENCISAYIINRW